MVVEEMFCICIFLSCCKVLVWLLFDLTLGQYQVILFHPQFEIEETSVQSLAGMPMITLKKVEV